ncbi:MAG: SCO family protein [Pseudomonadota bacterium]
MNSIANTLKPRFAASKPLRSLVARLALALAASGALALAACSPMRGPPPLEGADIGGAFTLINAQSETVTWDDFRGKYAVVYFGYAYCPDVCPTDMQRTAQGLEIVKERNPDLAANIRTTFITIDPDRDTPAVVGEFAAAFSDDIIGLTGSPEAIKSAADAFRVYYKKGDVMENGGYLVDHTNIVFLFDPDGNPMAMLPTDQGADAVADEIEKWAS